MSPKPLKAWFRCLFARLVGKRQPAYNDLLDEAERLKEIVLYWRYPDGSLVPQRKRQRLFRTLRSVRRRIADHPDNPDRHGEEYRGGASHWTDSRFD